jgi:hypothetical protein
MVLLLFYEGEGQVQGEKEEASASLYLSLPRSCILVTGCPPRYLQWFVARTHEDAKQQERKTKNRGFILPTSLGDARFCS